MKKRILSILLMLTLVISLLPVSVSAATPEDSRFPDPIFRAYVYQNYDTDGDGYLDTDECVAVTDMDVSEMGIKSLEGIKYFRQLFTLYCDGNKLTELDVSGNWVLMELYCYDNKLTKLNVSNRTDLVGLVCSGNELTSLDVSNNLALEGLVCDGNKLTELDVSNNTALTVLSCGENEIEALDVSNNLALEYLGCYANKLTELDVSDNTALQVIECDENMLTSLDVSNNTALLGLSCQDNELSELNISQNTALTEFFCGGNKLTELDVTKNKKLQFLGCGANELTKLNVSKNSELLYLDCTENAIDSIDISKTSLLDEYSSYFGNQMDDGYITVYMSAAQKKIYDEYCAADEWNVRVNVVACPFIDVAGKSYCYDPVMWAVEAGITSGMTATTFEPNSPCTRGQIVTFLWRAAGKPEPTSTENPFTDVKKGKSYYKAVLWAVEQGITTGVDATHFAPDIPCTRGQAVTFLWRAVGKPNPTTTEHPFTDVSSKGFYYNAMLWAVEQGITKGETKTTFAPDLTCTRGQIVTFLYRTK